jgi:hypothetical protein
MGHEESKKEREKGETECMSMSGCFVFPGSLNFEEPGEFLSLKGGLSLSGISSETNSKVHPKKAKENNPGKTKDKECLSHLPFPPLGKAVTIIPSQAGPEETC